MKKIRKIARLELGCVACGCCRKVCPVGAVDIYRGVTARIDIEKCVGCGGCSLACPAGVLALAEKEAV
ncbi:MAG: 4Fe-4S binding protein [Peptococcaceae bacterium]|nr:4Fe-4S binding protein [Peptococcaceae bacterium]